MASRQNSRASAVPFLKRKFFVIVARQPKFFSNKIRLSGSEKVIYPSEQNAESAPGLSGIQLESMDERYQERIDDDRG